jgi:hypothetical protein
MFTNDNQNKINYKNNEECGICCSSVPGYSLSNGYNFQNSLIIPHSIKNENQYLTGRYFVMKSLDEDNIHKVYSLIILKSIKYKIWCSSIKGNQKLQKAFKEADNKYPIYLFFR